jgi:DNA-binding transcriptional LysR family regulator
MACEAHFRQTGVAPRVQLELGSNEAIKQAVAGGLGLAIVSAHALGSHLGEDGLAVLPVRGFPIHSQWHLVQPRSRRLSPLAAVFREHVLRQAGLAGAPATGGGRRR